MKSQLQDWSNTDGTRRGKVLFLWCPGCDELHSVETEAFPTRWRWDGNLEAPTIAPSIRTWSNGIGKPSCHAFVRAGQWVFLADSFHALAGQTVPMVDLPDWVVR